MTRTPTPGHAQWPLGTSRRVLVPSLQKLFDSAASDRPHWTIASSVMLLIEQLFAEPTDTTAGDVPSHCS